MSVLLSKINLCVQRDHYAGTHARHIQSFPSTSSPVSSQRLLSYATSQEKSGTVATKLDEGWNCSISLVPKPGCGFPNWSHSSSAARLSVSVSSLNIKHGCTLYNNQDCLLFLKVETDYVTQLGRIWGAKSFLIQDFPIRILMTYVMLLATIKKLFFFLPFFPSFFSLFFANFLTGRNYSFLLILFSGSCAVLWGFWSNRLWKRLDCSPADSILFTHVGWFLDFPLTPGSSTKRHQSKYIVCRVCA